MGLRFVLIVLGAALVAYLLYKGFQAARKDRRQSDKQGADAIPPEEFLEIFTDGMDAATTGAPRVPPAGLDANRREAWRSGYDTADEYQNSQRHPSNRSR